MGLLDRFLDAIKLNDDDYDDDEFLDDDLDDDLDDAPKSRFFNRFRDDDDFDDERDAAPKSVSKTSKSDGGASLKDSSSKSARREKPAPAKRSKVTPIRKKSGGSMEVNVIRPVSMEDARDIADTLLDRCTVVLNLEGLDVDMAQRIIDFACGACYSERGSLQKVSSYIFILTPEDVDISGDYEDILSGSFNLTSMKSSY